MQAQGSLRATARTGDRVTIAVVTCASGDDLRAALTPMWHYFGRVPADDSIAALRRLMPPYRVHTAQDGAHVIGAAGSFAFELTVPGARVPAAGVTIVAVLPTHRRRGALRQMMRVQLDACRERAEPLAYLWAAEDGIYERFGYGIASFSAEIDAPRQGARLRDASSSPPHARLMPPREAQAVIAPIYERVAKATPGMFFRSGAWWQERTLADTPWRRGNSGELQCVIVECDAAQAYALYRLTPSFERGVHTGAVNVVEAMGSSSLATRAVWRYLLEIDWMARVTAALLPIDHPLLLLAAEPRRLRFNLRDGVWLRLVDVGAALTARRYAPAAPVVIEVADAFCPWNSGRWRVGADGVRRTTAAVELRCDVSALGSAYLGGFSWTQLARALRVVELVPGAAARADAAFRTACAPWCPEIF